MLDKVKFRFSGKSIIKITSLSLVIFFTAVSLSLAQDSAKSSSKKLESGMKMDMKSMHMDKNMKMDSSNKTSKGDKMKAAQSSPIAYKGVIDVKSIDDNKDGKVFQCPMDFNVLSDKPGVDPKCGMKLKEVSLEQAKNNLVKHDFKVK